MRAQLNIPDDSNPVLDNKDEPGSVQARLAAIVDSSDDAIISKDLKGIIHSWNDGARRIFGYTADEIIGRPVTMLIPPELLDEEPGIIERISRGERVDHYETIRCRKDGALINVSLTVSPLRDASGKVIGASKVARDITASRRLARQQQVLFDLVTTINRAVDLPDICQAAVEAVQRSQAADRAAILLYDADGVMRFKAWSGLSDEYRAAVEGHSPWKTGETNPQPICINNMAKADFDEKLRPTVLREGIRDSVAFIPLVHQSRLLGKFMIYYNTPHEFSAEELRPAQTIASQIVFAIERQRSGEALERLVNERTASLREAIAQMEEFSYTVSHDLRAPLRGMQGYSEMLLEDHASKLPEDAVFALRRISENSRQLDKMVLDVLTFSRIARADLRLEKVALEELLRNLVGQYPGLQAPRACIQIDSIPEVLGHEPSLIQTFSNLLNNAVKFVPAGITPQVRVWGERKNGLVRVWVSDNGIGIDPEYQHRLFNMFERLHPDLKHEGTGVGLAIVRKAVERMGGRVGVESDGKSGSRFWVEIRAFEP